MIGGPEGICTQLGASPLSPEADRHINVGKKAYTNPKTQQTLGQEFRRRNLCPLERRKKSLNLKKRNLRRKRSRAIAFT